MGVFIDIQAAFDSITPEHIRKSLLKHGCNPDMVKWYYELLKNRNLSTTYDNFILLISTNLGFPEGGVCSAKFWIIAFNDTAKILNTHGVSGELFADDGNGIIGGNDILHMATKLNQVCRDLSNWGKTCGFTFNPTKTIAILFSHFNQTYKKVQSLSLIHI